MTDRLRYVHTGSTSGGNGTENVTTGANRAYESLQAAELAERTDLTTLAGVMRFICTGTAADTTETDFTLANWPNPTASCYIQVEANTGQEAVMPYSTSRYRIERTTGNWCVLSRVPYTRYIGLQAKMLGNTSNGLYFYDPGGSGKTWTMERCHVVNASGAGGPPAFNYEVGTSVLKISNCVALSDNATSRVGFVGTGSTNTYIYNCTAYQCFYGFSTGGTGSRYTNCLADACGTAWIGTVSSSNYNASSTAAATGGANDRVSQTFTFVDTVTGDLHLASSDAGAKDFGVDLSGDANYPISVDFDNVTRSGSWDIGADEYVAAGADPPPFGVHAPYPGMYPFPRRR